MKLPRTGRPNQRRSRRDRWWGPRPRAAAKLRSEHAVRVHDVGTLEDQGLADHVSGILAHVRSTFEEHFRLHGYDLGPIGLLLLAGADWGLASTELLTALAGASPSTVEPREALARIRAALAETGVAPTSLEDVTAASPRVAEELHAYLRHRSSVLYAGYDLDSPTLGEAPDVILASILNARPTGPDPGAAMRLARASSKAGIPAGGRQQRADRTARSPGLPGLRCRDPGAGVL